MWRKGRREEGREGGKEGEREGGREGGRKGGREGGREREIGRGKGSHQQYSQVPTCTGFNYLIVMLRSGENPPINNVQCCHGNSGHRRKVTFVEKEHL